MTTNVYVRWVMDSPSCRHSRRLVGRRAHLFTCLGVIQWPEQAPGVNRDHRWSERSESRYYVRTVSARKRPSPVKSVDDLRWIPPSWRLSRRIFVSLPKHLKGYKKAGCCVHRLGIRDTNRNRLFIIDLLPWSLTDSLPRGCLIVLIDQVHPCSVILIAAVYHILSTLSRCTPTE
ncbi:MAG: hypothetical protein UY76_C0061G0002 [Candidatus Uhrbacteria bacterium GW2011_GWA2_52_8d]|uniref:Uncharacterized protein n=1 Tax=Candidatus Uhrbacteria bacterium GW2011_GWA2_52_8d TaxID=1618979 RepID=A0A0G1XK37_9BACT|nr:MAG: hypothetical protein UY76_C0061G0002 [Candidatus Uhrbacteria bacterium GW2011_GWA2_52_8d]